MPADLWFSGRQPGGRFMGSEGDDMVTGRMFEDFRELMGDAVRVAVLTGAGISQESNIETFRDPDGLWTAVDPDEVATPGAFGRDPVKVWSFHANIRETIARARPNAAHRVVAAMEERFRKVTVITQNIDNLHQEAGSSRVVELHGNAWGMRCTREDRRWIDRRVPLDTIPPLCQCGAMARPDVVWFGEPLPGEALESAIDAATSCDVILVIGTSVTVQPAASLPFAARDAGARVLEFNMGTTPLTEYAHASFRGPSGEVLSRLWSDFSGD
jgi:NAD-dependent deacetylase